MGTTRQLTKTLLRWAAVSLSLVIGFFALSSFERQWIHMDDGSLEWSVVYAPYFFLLLWNWRKARRITVIAVVTSITVAVVIFSKANFHSWLLGMWLTVWSAPFAVLGTFWLGTHRWGWNPLLPTTAKSTGRRIARTVFTCALILFIAVALTFFFWAAGSDWYVGSCRTPDLLLKPWRFNQAAFTARVVYTGRSFHGKLYNLGHQSEPFLQLDSRTGDWAIGVVQEKFWGLPWWMPRFVLLTDNIYWRGETYFVDGLRAEGPLSRVLPIVSADPCTRTRPASQAVVDVRVLRGLAGNGAHVIGSVRQPKAYAEQMEPPSSVSYLPGANIVVTGPTGKRIITTDVTGVYELDDLMPGEYTLELVAPENQVVGFWEGDGWPVHLNLRENQIEEHNFELFWNGRVKGRVRDDAGNPVSVEIELAGVDRTFLPGNVRPQVTDAKDGSYEIKKIPPGRYIVTLNPNGPHNDWPYEALYYRSNKSRDDAQVLQIAEGQEIKGIDFTVPRVSRRAVRVRVTWPDGGPVPEAEVGIAYLHSESFDRPTRFPFLKTDQNGVVVVNLCGKSRLRLEAHKFVYYPGQQRVNQVHSLLDTEATKVASDVTLVMNSQKP